MATRARRQFIDVFDEVATGFVVSDVASIAAGGRATVAVTVPGVATGGQWITLMPTASADPGNLIMQAKVTAADTVTIALENNTAGAIDPASMTYFVVALKLAKRFTFL